MTAINVPVLALRMDAAMAKLCMFRTKKVLEILNDKSFPVLQSEFTFITHTNIISKTYQRAKQQLFQTIFHSNFIAYWQSTVYKLFMLRKY